MNYKASVITSIFNSELFIEGFMENLLEQEDLESFEVFLLNADSTDDTENLILKHSLPPNVFYQNLKKKYSIYDTWNIGAKKATSNFLTNWNTDDRISKNSLKIHAEYMHENPECDISYGHVAWSYQPNEKYSENPLVNFYPCQKPYENFLLNHNSPHNMPMWKKRLHNEYGYFDPQWPTAADFEFWCRCYKNGAVFHKINEIFGLYYYNPNGLSTQSQSSNMEEGAKIREMYNEKNN